MNKEVFMKWLIATILFSTCITAVARDFIPSDVYPEDCVDKKAMKQAEKRLKNLEIGKVSMSKIKDACRFVYVAQQGSGIPVEAYERRLATFNAEFGFYVDEGRGMDICTDRFALFKLAKKHGVSRWDAHNTCRRHEKTILNSISPHPQEGQGSGIALLMFGEELLNMLDGLNIERNPYVSDLRIRFSRAHKPGIEPEASSPQSLVKKDGSPWLCTSNRPFFHEFGSFSSGNAVGTLRFYVYGNRVKDSDGFLYGVVNSLEMTAADPKGEGFLRNARMEYFCENINPANCSEDNADLRVLIIEESVRTKGLLYSFFSWLKDLKPDPKKAFMNYMAAKAWSAQGDYISKDIKECRKAAPFFGCEVAVNYLECWEDGEAALKALGMDTGSYEERSSVMSTIEALRHTTE